MKLNGSIPNINLGLSASVIGLLIFTIVVGGYYVAETKTVSEKNNRDIDILGKNQDVFVKTWLDAQRSQNKVSNESENQLLNLSRTNDKIIHQQLENEKTIIRTQNNTLGNLTSHKTVTNATFIKLNALLNNTLTNDQYAKAADKRVSDLLANITAQHAELINNQKTIVKLLENKTR